MGKKNFIFSVRPEYVQEVSEALEAWKNNGSKSLCICQAIIELWREEQKRDIQKVVPLYVK